MTYEQFYGSSFFEMKTAEHLLLDLVGRYPYVDAEDVQPIVYCCSRIKSPDSMMRKLKKLGLPQNGRTALSEVFDAIGVRVVCAFTEDVYKIVKWLTVQPSIMIIKEKDYIAYPKPNGYRSYHLQIRLLDDSVKGIPAEIQVRTIATDFWATLEHQLKYKKELSHEKLIRSELKRCADEIASMDLSMQTIRDILRK